MWWRFADQSLEKSVRSAHSRHHLKHSRRLALERLESRSLLATLPSGFSIETVVDGLYEPTAMVVAPDNRIFVTEKPYGVRLVKNGALLQTPVLSLPVERSGERGVEGIVLDPSFSTNGHFYVYYTRLEGAAAANRLSRFTISAANPEVADPASERVLVDGITTTDPGYHNGGWMQFGADGMLYVGIGDALNSSRVQDLSRLEGKILRIHPANYPNLIPPDNPFVGQVGMRGEIWALGLRNPFTGAMQPETGRMFVNDVGSGSFEEVNELARGANYGWPITEGVGSDPRFVNPIYSYAHQPGSSAAITGGVFYTGLNFPAGYSGRYFVGDYVRGVVQSIDLETGQVSDFAAGLAAPVDLDNSPDGNLYVLLLGAGSDTNGSIALVRYGMGNRAPLASATASPSAGLPPLAVQFDGRGSTDPDDDALSFQWNFGDGNTGSGAHTTHLYHALGTYTAQLTVSDGQAASTTSLTIVVGNLPPVPTITLPSAGATYRAGDTISFAGGAFDATDGALPSAQLAWKVVFHHGEHTHPFLDAIDGVNGGNFQIPLVGEVDPDQWYRIWLTATDSEGLAASTFVDLHPRLATFRLTANVPGIALSLDGQAVAMNAPITGVVGMRRAIAAPPTQTVGSRLYRFVGWSDGGAATHAIATPAGNTTYVAEYRAAGLVASYRSNPPAVVKAGKSITYQVAVTNNGSENWYWAGASRVELRAYFGRVSDAPGAWTTKPTAVGMRRVVAPGQSYTFTVKLTAPAKPGNYVLRHRMIKMSSNWFDTMERVSVTVVR